jgi:hypothetical protein
MEFSFSLSILYRETCLRLSMIYLYVRMKRTLSQLAATSQYVKLTTEYSSAKEISTPQTAAVVSSK